jgi:hypothetical protein
MSDGAPLIGEFSGPENNSPRKSFDLPSKREEQKKEEEVIAEAAAVDVDDDIKEQTPEELYREGLKNVGLSVEEARSIMAEVLVNDVCRERHTLGSNDAKVEVVLRSRTYADIQRAYRYLEAEKPDFPVVVNDYLATYNVAASLERFGDNVFDFPDPISNPDKADEAFQKRLNFLKRKNSFVLSKLTGLVAGMDNKLLAIFADGAPADF